MSLHIDARDVQGVMVLDLAGRLVLGQEADGLCQRVKQLVADRKARIVLNCEKVTHIDSAGAGAVVRCLNSAKVAGGDIRLAGPNHHCRGILDLTRISTILHIYSHEDEAVASFA